MINVLVWNEYIHEKNQPEVAAIYPEGIHHRIGKYLESDNDISVKYATLDMKTTASQRSFLTMPMSSYGGVIRLTTR